MESAVLDDVDADQLIGEVESAQEELICSQDDTITDCGSWANGIGDLEGALDTAFESDPNFDRNAKVKGTSLTLGRFRKAISDLAVAHRLTRAEVEHWYPVLEHVADWLYNRYSLLQSI